ncbi:MAG: PIN domain-containing protein [Arcobacter sp.]|uniref:PIN domain-containing protein n=1 Tax=Arcobacter sp. TaxID=1872629 RepID=UPI003CFFBC37
MIKEKVIFDTNFLLEKKLKNFFGKKDQLIKFSKVADIIIPDMVVQELLEWYKRNFEKEKEQFLKMALPNVLSHNTDSIKIDETLNQLLDLETGLFQVIDLKNPKYIFDMKQLALKKEPPFVPDDGSDKGFKDAYIYFTVLEYLEGIEDKYIFFVTNDKLLKVAFEKNPNIRVVESYDEFIQKSISVLYDDYFIAKLKSEIDAEIEEKNIIEYSINENENQILIINMADKKYIVEVDSQEIVDFKEEKNEV